MRVRRRFVCSSAAIAAVTSGCFGQLLLSSNPGPPNSTLGSPCALFFDLEALQGPVVVTGLTSFMDANGGQTFDFDLLIRDGTSLGGTATTGPGSSLDGWTSLGRLTGVEGPIGGGESSPVEVPRFVVQPGHVVGVALWFHYNWGPRFYRHVSEPYFVFQDNALRLTTGDGRSIPFVNGQLYFARCTLVGSVIYTPDPCYPNCDGSTVSPVLNVGDFICFQQRFAAGDSYANCDQSTTPPVLNVADFVCFLQRFAGGCS